MLLSKFLVSFKPEYSHRFLSHSVRCKEFSLCYWNPYWMLPSDVCGNPQRSRQKPGINTNLTKSMGPTPRVQPLPWRVEETQPGSLRTALDLPGSEFTKGGPSHSLASSSNKEITKCKLAF